MKNKKEFAPIKSGFTLIELLVVISIIGILAALATVSFTSTQKQARDTQRKSDLKQYQNALEVQANKNNGLYPVYYSGNPNLQSLCSSIGVDTSACPDDPKAGVNSWPHYNYQTDGDKNDFSFVATKYALWARLENTSTTKYWVLCSSGSTFSSSATPSIASCQ